jgi:ABC-2 type transport system ATP-binding protein
MGQLPPSQQVIAAEHAERQTTMVVRGERPIFDPAWAVEEVTLEDIVLAYMGSKAAGAEAAPEQPAVRHMELQR